MNSSEKDKLIKEVKDMVSESINIEKDSNDDEIEELIKDVVFEKAKDY